jgi:hypothetical protein
MQRTQKQQLFRHVINTTAERQALDTALRSITEASATLQAQQLALTQQQAVLLQQQQVLSEQQAAFTKQQVALLRQEPQWYPEPDPNVKLQCLRQLFLNGTERVERKVYSQYGEDGVIEAIFRCIGHRDKCVSHPTAAFPHFPGLCLPPLSSTLFPFPCLSSSLMAV